MRPVEIIICVRNAPALVAACLDSVRRTIDPSTRVTLVDDASAEETARLLRRAARRPGWCLIRNRARLGFVRSANAGLSAARAPCRILLNSDTIVTGDWLARLADCAGREGVGIVGPVSNAGGFQSVPEVFAPGGGFAANRLPEGRSPDWMAGLVAECAEAETTPLPVVNGFCMAIPQAVQARIGLFDEVTFPLGYGEEVDYCLRARAAGFENRVVLRAYVHHEKRGSFTEVEHRLLTGRNHDFLRQRYGPVLAHAMAESRGNPDLAALRARVAAALDRLAAIDTA